MTPEEILLAKVKELAKTEIETRGYQNKESVERIISDSLKDLPLDAIRQYQEDESKLRESIKNIAGELEKVKNTRSSEGNGNDDLLRRMVDEMLSSKEGKESQVELMMRMRGNTPIKEVELNVRAAVAMTSGTTIDVGTTGSYPQDMIESLNVLGGVVKKRRGQQYIADFADVQTFAEIEEYTTWYEEGDEQGAFAIVIEGGVKPLVSKKLVRNYAHAKKAAGKYVVTEEFTKFRKRAYAIIQTLINEKLQRDYNAILSADLSAQSALYVGTSMDHTKNNPNDYDTIAAVASQIETLSFFPDVLIIHPQDKWRIAMETDLQGRYFFTVPQIGADGIVTLLGFRVITSTYQPIGTAKLGESGLFKIEQESLTVRMGYGIDVTTAVVNGQTVVTDVTSDIDTNKMRVIVEVYFKDYIATNNIGSFVNFSFDTVKQALLKVA